MTAVDDRSGKLARASEDFLSAVEYWRDRCGVAEQERDELDRQLRDARNMIVERNGLLRRVCIEKAYTIRSEDALDELPVGSIIRDAQGYAMQCAKRPGAWFLIHNAYQFASDEVSLPVLVLWHPDWSDQ